MVSYHRCIVPSEWCMDHCRFQIFFYIPTSTTSIPTHLIANFSNSVPTQLTGQRHDLLRIAHSGKPTPPNVRPIRKKINQILRLRQLLQVARPAHTALQQSRNRHLVLLNWQKTAARSHHQKVKRKIKQNKLKHLQRNVIEWRGGFNRREQKEKNNNPNSSSGKRWMMRGKEHGFFEKEWNS